MKIRYIAILALVSLFTLSAFAKIESWDTFSEQKAEKRKKAASSKLSKIVIVRPKDIKGKAINIYIDGEYLSSLLPGAYTEEIVCSGKHRIHLAYTNVAYKYRQKRKGGQWIDFKSGKSQYVYMLTQEGGKLKFKYYPSGNISKLLKGYTKRQAHTISRVNRQKCTETVKRSRR